MKTEMVEFVLLQTRIRLLELAVLQLSVAMRFSAGVRPISAAVQATLEELDAWGQALERHAIEGAAFRNLTDSERTVFAREYRTMIEELKAQTSAIYSQQN
jgi:hypothetical protein